MTIIDLEDLLNDDIAGIVRTVFDAGFRAGANMDRNEITVTLVEHRIKWMQDHRSLWDDKFSIDLKDLQDLKNRNA